MMRRLCTLGLATLASLVAACGGGGIAITDLDDAFIDAQCEYYVRCGVVESTAVCRQLIGDGLNVAEVQGAIDDISKQASRPIPRPPPVTMATLPSRTPMRFVPL